jgi:hypothetical protein
LRFGRSIKATTALVTNQKQMIMSKFIIEKNVPLPKKVSKRIYPFNEMEIGESFLVAIEENQNTYNQKQKIYMAMWRFCQVHPDKKFTTASYCNEVRIWRIK